MKEAERAQRPVDVVGIGGNRPREALGEHHLDCVAGSDVLLGAGHGRLVLLALQIAGNTLFGRRSARASGGCHRRRGAQFRGERINLGDGGIVSGIRVAVDVGVAEDQDAVLHVVEDEQCVGEDQLAIGKVLVIGGSAALEVAHQIVARYPTAPP